MSLPHWREAITSKVQSVDNNSDWWANVYAGYAIFVAAMLAANYQHTGHKKK